MPLYIKLDLNADGLVTVKECLSASDHLVSFSAPPVAKATTVSQALRAVAGKYAKWAHKSQEVAPVAK